MIEVFQNEQNKAVFLNFRNTKIVQGVACLDNKKYVLDSLAKITLVKNSYKFPEELQFSICADKFKTTTTDRVNNSGWNTLEINMPVKEGFELIKAVYLYLKEHIENG